MPRWETTPTEDGERHELIGRAAGADVTVHGGSRVTVISVAMIVPGIDEATVERCKRRAEQLLAECQRGPTT